MKSSVFLIVVVCAALVGAVIYLNHKKVGATTAPAPVEETSRRAATVPAPSSEKVLPPSAEMATSAPAKMVELGATAAAQAVAKPEPSAVAKTVDALLSAKNGLQKHELFQQLVRSGQIDQAIAELKQRAIDNPNDPEIPTTLGEAQLNKVRALHEAGGDINEIGILAMQADQSFNAALKIDPQNWEAQFVKASSMVYWPADPVRDNDVVQRLSGLIDQQEKAPPQPEFVQTYIVLGNEYQKIGQPEKAVATWQLGAQKFPNDATLRKKLSGQ